MMQYKRQIELCPIHICKLNQCCTLIGQSCKSNVNDWLNVIFLYKAAVTVSVWMRYEILTLIQGWFITCAIVNLWLGSVISKPWIISFAVKIRTMIEAIWRFIHFHRALKLTPCVQNVYWFKFKRNLKTFHRAWKCKTRLAGRAAYLLCLCTGVPKTLLEVWLNIKNNNILEGLHVNTTCP